MPLLSAKHTQTHSKHTQIREKMHLLNAVTRTVSTFHTFSNTYATEISNNKKQQTHFYLFLVPNASIDGTDNPMSLIFCRRLDADGKPVGQCVHQHA